MPRPDRIAIVSADAALTGALRQALGAPAYQLLECSHGADLRHLLERDCGLVLVDLALDTALLPDIAAAIALHRALPVLLLVDGRVTAQRRHLEIWHDQERIPAVERVASPQLAAEQLRQQVDSLLERGRFLRGTELIGSSPAMHSLRERILRVAEAPVSTVLLIGESGAGKELVAQALHRFSERAGAPFVPLNCAAIPENLLESELFGHERGAFTDAKSQRRGLFEQADGGTVFLDEIGEMALAAQTRLLRVLEQREVTRVGSSEAVPVDIRVVAATNKDLQEAVSQREFRLDLYHRLKVVDLQIPPLRRRPEDIPLLIDHFVAQYGSAGGERFPGFTDAAMELLSRYSWPGNVRELRNLIEHLVYLGPRRPVEPDDLLTHLEQARPVERHLPVPAARPPDQSERELIYFALLDLKREVAELRRLIETQGRTPPAAAAPIYHLEPAGDDGAPATDEPRAVEPLRTLKELEKEAIQRALARVGGNRKQAAGILGISPRTLYRKLDEYDLR